MTEAADVQELVLDENVDAGSLTFMKNDQTLNFTKAKVGDAPLRKVKVTLEWESAPQGEPIRDADVTVMLLQKGPDGNFRIPHPSAIIGYPLGEAAKKDFTTKDGSALKVWKTPNNSVVHYGDNRTGGDQGMDGEQIDIDFTKLPSDGIQIALIATIDDALGRGHSWGAFKARLRIADVDTGRTVVEYSLTDMNMSDSAVFIGSFYIKDKEYLFHTVGQGSNYSLQDYAHDFGLPRNS